MSSTETKIQKITTEERHFRPPRWDPIVHSSLIQKNKKDFGNVHSNEALSYFCNIGVFPRFLEVLIQFPLSGLNTLNPRNELILLSLILRDLLIDTHSQSAPANSSVLKESRLGPSSRIPALGLQTLRQKATVPAYESSLREQTSQVSATNTIQGITFKAFCS